MASHSNEIFALQLTTQLGLGAYRTAWMLCHRLRRAKDDPDRRLLSGWIDVDETLISQRTKQNWVVRCRGRRHDGRMAITAAVELAGYEVTKDS